MANRKHPIQVKFRVTPEERALIQKKMEQLGTNNMAAYLRKMAIDGYVVKLDLPELREMISLLRRSSNNLNQIAKRVNSTNRLYDTDMEEMLQTQEQLWTAANEILTRLASIR
jgi:hypothetical protein